MNAENDFANCACSEYEVMLEEYLEGTLENGAVRKLSEHLKSCAGCSEALRDATEAANWLHQAERTPDPGPAFTHMVMTRVRTYDAEERPGFWEPFVSLAWKFATTAALALVVMLAYAAHGTKAVSSEGSVATASGLQGEMQEILVAGQSNVPATRSDMVRMVTESDNAEQ
jgi:hypothetical protein